MSESSDMPDLESPFVNSGAILLDKQQLSCGDPAAPFDEQRLQEAMQKRQQALEIYKQDSTRALLLITDAIVLFPNSALYLNARAEIFRFLGDVHLSERDLKLVLQRIPEPPFKTLKMLAEIQFDLQEFQDCMMNCKLALQRENSAELSSLLQEASLKFQQQKTKQEQFELQQQAQKQQTQSQSQNQSQNKKSKMENEIQEEIAKKFGENPIFQSPLFKNLFGAAQNMNPQKADELSKNSVLMGALEDPEFGRKIAEVAKDPKAAAKYAQDPKFMQAFGEVLGAFK